MGVDVERERIHSTMRVLSTPQSIAQREPTIFALGESLAAIAISLGIAIHFETLAHIAIGACLAPFLLMRSPASIELGRRWFTRVALKKPGVDDPFRMIWNFLKILVASVLIKILATIRHPLKGFRAIPTNWAQVVLCTDINTPVELVPGCGPVRETLRKCAYEEEMSNWGLLLFGAIFAGLLVAAMHVWVRHWFSSVIWRGLVWFLEAVFIFSALAFALGLGCYLVGYLYRLSLKSTALIWLPLLYVVRTTFDETLTLRTRLEEIRESALWKLIRLISWLTLALLTAKIVVLPAVIDWWNLQRWTQILNVYVMPNQIHTWHIAAGLNSLVALAGYFFFLERAPRYMLDGAWTERTVALGLQTFRFVRVVISTYTISVGLYLTFVAARSMKWPSWSGEVVPW